MMDRRRALMMQANGGDASILYELLNHAVQTGASIDTGVAPFIANLDATIMLDFNQTYYESASGAPGSLSKYMITTTSGNSKFVLGKYGRSDANVRYWWMNGTYQTISGTTNGAVRKRFIVTHQRNSGTITIHVKTGTNAKTTVTVTQTFTASPTNLRFGGSGAESLCAGTINTARIYNRILEQSEIDEFFA